jgi:hypothetical protein
MEEEPLLPDGGILVLNLSRQSTGEIRFLTALLKGSPCEGIRVDLALYEGFDGLFPDFPGTRIPVRWTRKVSPDEVLAYLGTVANGYGRILFLDLTSAMLEYSWTREQAETLLERISTRWSAELLLFDPMAVMEKDPSRLDERRRRCEDALDEFIAENLRVPGHVSVKKAFYFSKYLKPRTLNQLVRIPPSASVLRSVPYTWPSPDDHGAFRYFKCHFEVVPDVAPREDFAVLGFSKMVENLLPGETIAEYFDWLCSRIRDEFGIREIVAIDPSRFLVGSARPEGLVVQVHERMERSAFLGCLGKARFAGCFIPTTTVGVTAIQSGIPFISFHSSRESSDFIAHKSVANAIPRYTSLGIWEDFAFIRDLLRPENPYFQGVRMLDVSEPGEFRDCRVELDSGVLRDRIATSREALAALELPSFVDAAFA